MKPHLLVRLTKRELAVSASSISMSQNGIPKINLTKNGGNYTIKSQQSNLNLSSQITSVAMDTNLSKANESSKKRKIISPTISQTDSEEQDKWLSNVPVNNPFSILQNLSGDTTEDNITTSINPPPKPPPIYIEARVIEPLMELLKEIANDNFTIKQLKNSEVKIQVNTSDDYRKLTSALKEKNANFYTYQLKKDRSYKVVLRGMHPSMATGIIIDELKKLNHQVRQINNITKSVTKEPLPLFFIELEPNVNNKEIYKINRLYNMVVSFEPPKTKRDIPQCLRCQSYGHTKNYCNRTPACVKCAGKHWTSSCPYEGKINNVKCSNCQGNHPASYKGCLVRKQLQQKLFPKLRHKPGTPNLNPLNVTYTNHNNNAPEGIHSNIGTRNKTFAEIARNQVRKDPAALPEDTNFASTLIELKNLLITSTKNSELITSMLLQQTQLLTQQSQQINKMLELLSLMLNNNNK